MSMQRNIDSTCKKIFIDEPMLRYYVKVDNVWEYLMDPCAAEIADHSKTISGWCTTSGCQVIRDRYPEAEDVWFVAKDKYYETA